MVDAPFLFAVNGYASTQIKPKNFLKIREFSYMFRDRLMLRM